MQARALTLAGIALFNLQPTASCSVSWNEAPSGTCFKLHEIEMTMTECVDYCDEHYSGIIGTFGTSADENHVRNLYQEDYFYIGLFEAGADESGDWQWVDGSNSPYTNWEYGEPNNWCADEDCTLVGPAWGGWVDVACNADLYCLCQKSGVQSQDFIDKRDDLEDTGDPSYEECAEDEDEDEDKDEDKDWDENDNYLDILRGMNRNVTALVVIVVLLFLMAIAMVALAAKMFFCRQGNQGTKFEMTTGDVTGSTAYTRMDGASALSVQSNTVSMT